MEWMLIPLAGMTLGPLAWVANTWIRARHGYPVENIMTPNGGVSEARKVELLTGENARQAAQIGRLEERIAVLERIVTDPADRTARAIDALR